MNNGYITITSGTDTCTFTPASLKISYESLASPDSGRNDDGSMHIGSWILRKITKLDITLPPHKIDDPKWLRILSLVQGQVYSINFYDYLAGQRKTKQVYTSNSSAEWYSGIILNGIVQNVGFSATEMQGESTVVHIQTEKLATPNPSIIDNVITWPAITKAASYKINDNGIYTTQTNTTYTIQDVSQDHQVAIQALSNITNITDSDWSQTISYIHVDPMKPCTSLTFPAHSLTLEGIEDTWRNGLIALPEPQDTTDELIYTSGNTSIAEVNGSLIKTQAAGNVVITATCGSQTDSYMLTVVDTPEPSDAPKNLAIDDQYILTWTPDSKYVGKTHTIKIYKADGTPINSRGSTTDHSYDDLFGCFLVYNMEPGEYYVDVYAWDADKRQDSDSARLYFTRKPMYHIIWNDDMLSNEVDEADTPIWDVREKTIDFSQAFIYKGYPYYSSTNDFWDLTAIAVDFEGAISYTMNNGWTTMVYETSGGQSGWEYYRTWTKQFHLLVNPATIFTGDWAHFLAKNGTVTQI